MSFLNYYILEVQLMSGIYVTIRNGCYYRRTRVKLGYVPSLPRQWQVAVKVWQSTPCCIDSFWAPGDGQRSRLKHVEHFTEINNLYSFASRWLYLKIRLRCTDPWTSNSDLYPERFILFHAYVLDLCVIAFCELRLNWVKMLRGVSVLKMTSVTKACLIEIHW